MLLRIRRRLQRLGVEFRKQAGYGPVGNSGVGRARGPNSVTFASGRHTPGSPAKRSRSLPAEAEHGWKVSPDQLPMRQISQAGAVCDKPPLLQAVPDHSIVSCEI